MWPVDERLRLEQELRGGSATDGNYLNQGPRGLVPMMMFPGSNLQSQLSREQQIAMADMQRLQASQGSSPSLLPPSALLNAQSSLATGLPSSTSTASSRLQLLRLVRLQEEREILERQHALTLHMEEAQQQEILNQQSGATYAPGESPKATTVKTKDVVQTNIPIKPSPEAARVSTFSPKRRSSTAVGAPKQAASKVASPKKVAAADKPKSKKKDIKWLATLEELKEYKNTYGDCIVPRGHSDNPRLASWVAEQRKQYKLLMDNKQSSITQERIDLLNALGFAWNAQDAAWTRHMDDLKAFKKECGHCHVPLNHHIYPKLGLWVKEQRRHYTLLKQEKPSHMTNERAEELNAVGFCWDTHEASWLERLRELKNFKKKHGNCAVPTNYAANPKLGTWVHHQRRQYKKFNQQKPCHINEERIRALDELGFIWKPREHSTAYDEEDESLSGEDSSTETDDDDEEEEDVAYRPPSKRRRRRV